MTLYDQFIQFGQKCVWEGLLDSFFGNMSVVKGDMIYITATGTIMDMLSKKDIVEVSLHYESEYDSYASSELPVHRMIYHRSQFKSVLHAHSLYTVLFAEMHEKFHFDESEILPFLENIKIVEGKSGTTALAEKVGAASERSALVVVKNHGVFSCGSDLKEAYIKLSALEHICKKEILKKIVMKDK